MSSNAVSQNRISRITGYELRGVNLRTTSPNLPQRIAIFGEANDANQGSLVPDIGQQITNAQQAGKLYGYGSTIYLMARILFPLGSDGVGGIPVFVYPQAAAVGAAARVLNIEASGVATKNGTHTVVISGRAGLDGAFYDINILAGDDAADVAQKIEDAVNAVLGAPVIADNNGYDVDLTAKWKGLTSQFLDVYVDTGNDDLGLTYAVTEVAAGSGTPSIAGALAQFGSIWNTIVLNGYGVQTNIWDALEAFNGHPGVGDDAPTGRYAGIIMKPFVAISGSTAEDPSGTTDTRSTELTNAIAPAPNSKGFPFEAAANMVRLFAVVEDSTPHLDVGGRFYADMPVPADGDIGVMKDYNSRDAIVKKGCSTVDIVSNRYQVQDFVTTYHPEGEIPPQWRYCRNIMLDMNIRFRYHIAELEVVVDKTILDDDAVSSVNGTVKPKQWKQRVRTLADECEDAALITDKAFMKENIVVNIGTTNPDRFETQLRYKRSGIARISSTTAEAGFNFGVATEL